MHLQAVLLCVQRPEYARHCNFAVLVLLVGMQSQSLRTSRNRDGCALLRSAERAFCKNAKPASARCRTPGLGCAQQVLATQVVFVYTKTLLAREFRCTRMVPQSTACRSDCASPNCQFRLQLLYWTHQKFFRRLLP